MNDRNHSKNVPWLLMPYRLTAPAMVYTCPSGIAQATGLPYGLYFGQEEDIKLFLSETGLERSAHVDQLDPDWFGVVMQGAFRYYRKVYFVSRSGEIKDGAPVFDFQLVKNSNLGLLQDRVHSLEWVSSFKKALGGISFQGDDSFDLWVTRTDKND